MHRFTIAATVSLGVLAGCYKDDTLTPAGIAPTVVLLTDDPFPFDSVKSVNIYVSRIEASAEFDTSGSGPWVEVAAPQKTFDLLTLQQGTTANLGAGALDAGHYVSIRMTIDVDRSSIKLPDNSDAIVHWPGTGHGEDTIYALVEDPVAVSATGAEIVIDFDVGSSFLYRLTGENDFYVRPHLRAVNTAGTGAIKGTVTGTAETGQPLALANANIRVYGGDSNAAAQTWPVVATGHTDLHGRYKVAFLPAGSYSVRVEQPIQPAFAAVTTPNVSVVVGDTTTLNVLLPRADGLHISGSTTVGIGGATLLRAALNDSAGAPVNAAISWTSRSPSIAVPVDSFIGDSLEHDKFVLGLLEGSAWIVATSGSLSDSVLVQVVSPPNPNSVATVTVTPLTLDMAVGDSSGQLFAELRDSLGNILTDRQISWLPADSSGVVELLVAVGSTAVLQAMHTGSVVIRAICEGKTGSATVTVH